RPRGPRSRRASVPAELLQGCRGQVHHDLVAYGTDEPRSRPEGRGLDSARSRSGRAAHQQADGAQDERSRGTSQATADRHRPDPARGRVIEGDALIVRPNNAADVPEAIRRIKTLGNPPIGSIGQPNTLEVIERADGAIQVKFTDAAFDKMQADALSASMESVNRRGNNSGLVEPKIQKEGGSRMSVEVPGADEAGMNQLIDTLTQAGVLTLNMVDESANPADYEVGVERNGRIALPDDSMGGQPKVVFVEPIIRGSDLQGASGSRD